MRVQLQQMPSCSCRQQHNRWSLSVVMQGTFSPTVRAMVIIVAAFAPVLVLVASVWFADVLALLLLLLFICTDAALVPLQEQDAHQRAKCSQRQEVKAAAASSTNSSGRDDFAVLQDQHGSSQQAGILADWPVTTAYCSCSNAADISCSSCRRACSDCIAQCC
jgi:hypothetical protein